MNGQLHTPAGLSPGKIPWYPLDRRLGGTQSRTGHGDEEKNSHPLFGLEPPIIRSVQEHKSFERKVCGGMKLEDKMNDVNETGRKVHTIHKLESKANCHQGKETLVPIG